MNRCAKCKEHFTPTEYWEEKGKIYCKGECGCPPGCLACVFDSEPEHTCTQYAPVSYRPSF